mgnify:CR=1 FL=1
MEAIITHKTRTCHKCKGTGERGFHAADGMGCKLCGGTGIIRTLKAGKSWALVQAKRTELSVAPYAELAVGDLLGSKRVLYVSIRGDQVVYAREGEVRPEGFHIFRRAAIKCEALLGMIRINKTHRIAEAVIALFIEGRRRLRRVAIIARRHVDAFDPQLQLARIRHQLERIARQWQADQAHHVIRPVHIRSSR